ncbi:ribonuclease P protein subunit p29 isoform X2 [Phyllopteryx taeniolatus]|uniref:ribonuclease P protein subunit p29 isoform X2 n=1 Tax=Phyllopteryx taeniolatus TaxID=161469 RepID=UPI002AD494CB|nr:ribonuclease P protein subunit p29 isoform X2 [Phyllopteryx taeniolatus]
MPNGHCKPEGWPNYDQPLGGREAVVDTAIPRDLVKVLGVESQIRSEAEAFTRAFLHNNTEAHPRHDPKSLLSHKAVILEYPRTKKKALNKKRAKGINAQQKRQLKIFHLKSEHQRYELFLPLHELWKQYILDLCNGFKPTSSPQSVQQKLLKADFHGAIITGGCSSGPPPPDSGTANTGTRGEDPHSMQTDLKCVERKRNQ